MSSMLVSNVIQMAEKQLTEAGITECKAEAEILYCWLKRIDRSKFFMEWGEPIDDRTLELFFDLIQRRCQRIPLQHLVGTQDFMGMEFEVDPSVLIPRQDSEVVAARAEELFRQKHGDTILDLCCGSGAIGIALARRVAGAKVTATDISGEAVALTKKNAGKHGVKVDVKQGDLFDPIRRKRYHMIVSNPPYIPTWVIPTLMPEVKEHEPVEALDGGADGLDFYRRIVSQAPEHLKKEGLLVLEIGYDQGESVERLIMETEKFCNVEIGQDLAGKDRVVTAQLIGKGR